MKRFTSRELAAPISEKTGIAEDVVRTVLLALDDTVGEHIVAGDRVEITGLGSFHIIVNGWTRRNVPSVGNIRVPAKYDVKFNPSKALERRYAGLPALGPEVIEDDTEEAEVVPGPDAVLEQPAFGVVAGKMSDFRGGLTNWKKAESVNAGKPAKKSK